MSLSETVVGPYTALSETVIDPFMALSETLVGPYMALSETVVGHYMALSETVVCKDLTRPLSCDTVVFKHFASYQGYSNYRWDLIR
jgi:hypothetical protein